MRNPCAVRRGPSSRDRHDGMMACQQTRSGFILLPHTLCESEALRPSFSSADIYYEVWFQLCSDAYLFSVAVFLRSLFIIINRCDEMEMHHLQLCVCLLLLYPHPPCTRFLPFVVFVRLVAASGLMWHITERCRREKRGVLQYRANSSR